MDRDKIRANGRFPVLSGPDRFELLMCFVEPIVMGVLREIVIRIETRERTIIHARGPLALLQYGSGKGLYDLVIQNLDGGFLQVRGYSPKHGFVLGCTMSETFDSPIAWWDKSPSTHCMVNYEIPRFRLLTALSTMRLGKWPKTLPVLGINLPTDEPIDLDDMTPGQEVATITLEGGVLKALPIGVYRDPQGGPLMMQFVSERRNIFYGPYDLMTGRLEWISYGWGWSPSILED